MALRSVYRFICGLFLLLCLTLAVRAADLQLVARQVLAGDTKWDYLSFDAASHRLFITHGNQVDVWDVQESKLVGSIADTQGVHGVALAPALNRGFTSNGISSTISIFELSSLKVLGTLPTQKKPDAIIYDPLTQHVFVANGDSGTLTVVDAHTSAVLGTVDIGGKLEFQAVDGKGRLYVNVEDQNRIAVVDTRTHQRIASYDIASACKAPTGLSIDVQTDRLFVGCRNQTMAVVDGLSGAILSHVAVGKGCDATVFDPVLKRAYASSGDGTLTVLDTDTYAVQQVVQTQTTARTLALDPTNHRLYLVAATAQAPTVEGARPTLVPGTFTLLTVQ